MTDKKTLLDRAKIDLFTCKHILASDHHDELFLDIAAYHLQQAIEKTMKYNIQNTGNDYPRSHDIEKLWDLLDSLNQTPPEWLWEQRNKLNDFATKTRYGEDVVATRRGLKELFPLAQAYIDDTSNRWLDSDDEYSFSSRF